MNAKQFFADLSLVQDGEHIVVLEAGRVELICCGADAWAGKLIGWLYEQLPPDTTQGDLEAILDMAKWWAQFWHMRYQADQVITGQEAPATQEAMQL